jgi:serine/threonine protein kinase
MRDLLPHGTLLDGGKYRIDYALGQGGFGITYRAADLNLDRLVAIKEFYPGDYVQRNSTSGGITVPTSDADSYGRWLMRFEREGRILARLAHPGIVKVHSLFKERETAYLVMELLQGGTLADELKQQPNHSLSKARIVNIMTALTAALDTVHQEGVYHLDLKPDNVMVTQDGRIVLVDFGAARQDLNALGTERSKKSTSAFTMEYAPPELIGGQSVSAASDLFELGMILHEMLTGQRPDSSWNRLLRDTWSAAEPLEKPWRELVTTALRLRPEERPQSVMRWWQTYADFAVTQQQSPGADQPKFQNHQRRPAQTAITLKVMDQTDQQLSQQDELRQERTRAEWPQVASALNAETQINSGRQAHSGSQTCSSPRGLIQKLDRHFWIQWAAFTALGLGLGGSLGSVVNTEMRQELWFSGLMGAFLAGSILGVAQWLSLRAYLARADWWIPITAFGTLVGAVPGWLLFRFVYAWLPRNLATPLSMSCIGLGLASIGALQWLFLRQYSTKKIPIPWMVLPSMGAVLSLSGVKALDGAGF